MDRGGNEMIIKILGKGCKNCAVLEENARIAAQALSIDYTIEKVTDINEISDYGVMRTPALVVENTLMSQGKVLTVDEIKSLLK